MAVCDGQRIAGRFQSSAQHGLERDGRTVGGNGHAPQLQLNVGGGNVRIPGFVNVDRKDGKEAYPLPYEDDSVDTIYASHVLEHFSHTQVSEVVNHWVQKLKPGGKCMIAVPNFEWISQRYINGEPVNVQGYTMGGHVDGDDYHRAIFDRETLAEIMVNAGLERIGFFESFAEDCSRLPVSLNLQGFKPVAECKISRDVVGCLSAPRYGPVMHMRCAFDALAGCRVPFMIGQGAYWHQVLCEVMEDLMTKGSEFILTLDYDTIFGRGELQELYRLMRCYNDLDAVCAVQMKRGALRPLFGMLDETGAPRSNVGRHEFNRNVTPVTTGHFGMTLFRTESLKKIQRPWMNGIPNDEGRWGKGKVDPDIYFWQRWQQSGLTLGLANKVIVGHMEEMIAWPNKDLQPVYQGIYDFESNGVPKEVLR